MAKLSYRNAFCSQETKPISVNYLGGQLCYSSQLGLIPTSTSYYLGKLGRDEYGNCIILRENPLSRDHNYCWSQNPNGVPFVDGSWIPIEGKYERSSDTSNLYFCIPISNN
ncbi:MAG: hypothetical protein QXY45_02235 [Candidatus Aenigmatarchaeota archaeon]